MILKIKNLQLHKLEIVSIDLFWSAFGYGVNGFLSILILFYSQLTKSPSKNCIDLVYLIFHDRSNIFQSCLLQTSNHIKISTISHGTDIHALIMQRSHNQRHIIVSIQF